MTGVMVVTGGGRGIGAAVAREAGRQGYKVCVNYSRSREAAEAVADDVRALGTEAIAVAADVASEDDVTAMFAAVDEALGPVTALVNNAGVLHQTAIVDMTAADVRRIMDVNLLGTVLCAREAVRRMGEGGVIVNVSSISARTGGGPKNSIYAASKGAVDGFTIGLAKELAPQGIRVCAVRPGLTETEIFDASVGLAAAQALAREGGVPLGRMARPEEIAALIVWLCSPAASYVTGALYDVSGGR